jgi:hypothetical protein
VKNWPGYIQKESCMTLENEWDLIAHSS